MPEGLETTNAELLELARVVKALAVELAWNQGTGPEARDAMRAAIALEKRLAAEMANAG